MKTTKAVSGFTMIEVMTVVAIVGIVVALAAPDFLASMRSLRLGAAARDQVSYLRLARQTAVTESGEVGVYIDSTSQALTLFYDLNGNSIMDGGDSTFLGPIAFSSDIRYRSCSFPNRTLVFRPNGSASGSGTLELGSRADSTRSYTVEVLASTGRVKLR
jgi:prepilin-type N-terminal cleavage/methylation domain-containing protein